MIDEKAAPPSYMTPPQPQAGYDPAMQSFQGQPHPPQQQPSFSSQGPLPPQPMHAQSAMSGMSGYPPAQTPPGMANLNAGAQYQQQLFAQCAAGNHDVTTKHGIFGIIMAIVCFPCGLICLFTDTEKRCVRCQARVG